MKRKKEQEKPICSSNDIPWASATAMRMFFDHKLERYEQRVRESLNDAETIQTQIAIDEVLAGIDDIRNELRELSEEQFLLEFQSAFAPKWWTEMLPED